MDKSTDIVAVREENDLLALEVVRLTDELEEKDQLLAEMEKEKKNGRDGLIKRLFARWFGVKVYDGPKTCGHCRYWDSPEYKLNCHGKPSKGDCKLLFGKEDTTYEDTCERFTPKRKYMRRVKIWREKP